MEKRLFFIALLLISSMLLFGCGSAGSLADEPYEAVSYELYPAPEDAYVGDTMPYVTDDGGIIRSTASGPMTWSGTRISAWR